MVKQGYVYTYCVLIWLYCLLYVQTTRLTRKMRITLAMVMIGAITLQSSPSCWLRVSLSLFIATSSSEISIISRQQLTQAPTMGRAWKKWRKLTLLARKHRLKGLCTNYDVEHIWKVMLYWITANILFFLIWLLLVAGACPAYFHSPVTDTQHFSDPTPSGRHRDPCVAEQTPLYFSRHPCNRFSGHPSLLR